VTYGEVSEEAIAFLFY
jgi:hypothetical protein